MKRNSIVLALTIILSACGGGSGGGGNDNNTGSSSAPTPSLVPLNISINDLSGNSLPYIDVSQVGSHTQYKLTFTNPNSVAVTGLTSLNFAPTIDMNWIDYQASSDKLNLPTNGELSSYYQSYNPGITWSNNNNTTITSYFTKTTNADDCFNVAAIKPGSSCSFYTTALWSANYTSKDTFSYPLSYTFYQAGNISNSLKVQQYNYNQGYGYSKSNMPGLSNQFITYKINPTKGIAPNPIGNSFTGISNNGNYLYMCDSYAGIQYAGINCGKYQLNYDNFNNSLTYSQAPLNFFPLNGIALGNREPVDSIFVTPDGNMAWFVIHNNKSGDYYLINSVDPNYVWTGICNGNSHCVPNMYFSTYNGGVIGLDGSFWWNPSNSDNADIYEPSSNTFVQTNIGVVNGVTSDGFVIGWSNGTPKCFTKSGSSPTSYISSVISNYTYTEPSGDGTPSIISWLNAIYVRMKIPNLVNSFANPINNVYGYYKVNTSNGECMLDLNDYTVLYNTSMVTLKFTAIVAPTSINSSGYVITPTSNVYLGY